MQYLFTTSSRPIDSSCMVDNVKCNKYFLISETLCDILLFFVVNAKQKYYDDIIDLHNILKLTGRIYRWDII